MSRRHARVLGTAAALAAVAFGLLTAYAGTRPSPTRVDLDVQAAFIDHRDHLLTALARTLTFCGSTPELYVGLLVGIVLVWRRFPGGRPMLHKPRLHKPRLHKPRLPLCGLLWFAAGQLLRTTINQIIERPRPPADLRLTGAAGYAFPSGHTTSATIAYGLAVVLVATYARRRRTIVITVAAAILGAIGVGLSRIYLGVHWPTDVAAGWTLGLFWLSIGVALSTLPRVVARRPEAP